MNIIPIHMSTQPDRHFYLLNTGSQLHYAMTMEIRASYEPAGGHMCAYLNLDRRLWDQGKYNPDDRLTLVAGRPITYIGISSGIMNLPNKVLEKFPIIFYDYWIGIDTTGWDKIPSHAEMVEHIFDMASAIDSWGLVNA